MTQQQFLNVIDRDEAERRLHQHIRLTPRDRETVPLDQTLGRVLCEDITAPVDVPSFDRSNLDGFAVRAEDTVGASELTPVRIPLLPEVIPCGVAPRSTVTSQTAISIATGGMIPRGANAIVMVEHTDVERGHLIVRRAVAAGAGITFAGTDIAEGQIVLRRGDIATSRETGVLAALGITNVPVWQRPTVAIVSTGDEILEPGDTMRPGMVYDSNARILSDAVIELGGQPRYFGIVHDDLPALQNILRESIRLCDIVLLSGGTSKGQGDLSYQAVAQLRNPGIVAHGVALKPGKPICLAAVDTKSVVILPGFPTSAVFTFHEFVAPVIRRLAGRPAESAERVQARLAVRLNSDIGRTEYALVGLSESADGSRLPAAFPLGKGSGSVTTYSHADGFVTIDRHRELIEEGEAVEIQTLGRNTRLADLIIIGSHCIGLDMLIGLLNEAALRSKFLSVGSTAGLNAATRGECDVAGIHLWDEATGQYNRPFVDENQLYFLRGYTRKQGIVYRLDDSRFQDTSLSQLLERLRSDNQLMMVNRNKGSGTRILIDQLLQGSEPDGYQVQSRNHNAVAAAVRQGRADWGVAIQQAVRGQELGFLPVQDECFDFVIPRSRVQRSPVQAFIQTLKSDAATQALERLGLQSPG